MASEEIESLLREGNLLCRGTRIPISPEVIEKVTNIYKICNSGYISRRDTPLIYASRLGLEHMVWGFIECAKQTNTNFHNGVIGKPREFLRYRNNDDDTALHVAVANHRDDMAMLLLQNASPEQLISYKKGENKTLLSILRNSKYDTAIFEAMEAGIEVDTWTSTVRSYDYGQGSTVYNETTMEPNSFPRSHKDNMQYSLYKLDDGQLELTANRNNILHLVAILGDVRYVAEILHLHPSLVYMRNLDGEMPAYVATREGHLDILAMMLNHFKTKGNDIVPLMTRSMDNHNALHIAIQNHYAPVVFLLIKEVPQLANYINNFGESSLYLGAERGYHSTLKLMLDKCIDIDFGGPNAKTTLHVAAISRSQDCIKYLLHANLDLLYIEDQKHWTPLHYAIHHNNSHATKMLLWGNESIGYQTMTEDGKSPIHIAASLGHCETVEAFISTSPGFIQLTDNKGKNILHVAVEYKKIKVIEFLLQDESLTSLINQRDNNGDTPIHLLMDSDLELMESVIDYRINLNVLNNQNHTPLDMASSDEKRERLLKAIAMDSETSVLSPPLKDTDSLRESDSNEKEKKKKYKVVENVLIIVTLIATATFAAAFTVPGGFQSDDGSEQGTPILLQKPAFIVFVINNTIAFSCSCSVLIGHMVIVYLRAARDEPNKKEQEKIDMLTGVMYYVTGFAMLTMTLAFVTGLFVVLTPSPALAIFSCLMSFFIIGYTFVFPLKFLNLMERILDLIREIRAYLG